MESSVQTMPRPYFKAVDPDGWLRTADAARELQVSKRTILAMIDDGRLSARRGGAAGKLFFVDPESIARLRRANPNRGRE